MSMGVMTTVPNPNKTDWYKIEELIGGEGFVLVHDCWVVHWSRGIDRRHGSTHRISECVLVEIQVGRFLMCHVLN